MTGHHYPTWAVVLLVVLVVIRLAAVLVIYIAASRSAAFRAQLEEARRPNPPEAHS